MLDRIIAFSLRNRMLVLLAAVALAVYGGVVARGLRIDVLPDLNRPTVTVMTEAHGMVPADIERLVTWPIERAVNGATGVVRVRSSSGMGLSVVYLEFDWDTDIYRNRQLVQERLQLAAARLPDHATPRMAPISSIMGQILVVGIRSRTGATDAEEIRALADRTLRVQLMSVPGVAQVTASGGAPRQLQVIVDAERLRALDVTLPELRDAVRDANIAGSGGVLRSASEAPLVSVSGLVRGADDLRSAVVRAGPPRPVTIGDVAEVSFGPAAVRTGDAGVMDGQGVLLTIYKQPGIDTLELTGRIDAELADMAALLPADLEILPGIYRQGDFIERAVDNVADAVRDGSILVVIVLLLFLLNARTTFITLTAIPLSVATTAIVFDLAGISINTMTLGGLAVAIGALVDDAIVDVENVFRRLRENRAAGAPRGALRVVFAASSEVRRPILIGTLVVAAVYVPLFQLTGMEGRLFGPIGVTYITSILASLLVSLTVTPALCSFLLPNSGAIAREHDSAAVTNLRRLATPLIRFSIRHPAQVTAAMAALLLASTIALGARGSEFLPPFNEGAAQVNLFLPPGVSVETSSEHGLRLQRVVLGVDGVARVGRLTGRAEDDEHTMDVNTNEMVVTFDTDSPRSREQMLAEIRDRVEDEFPGVSTSTEQPLAHLLSHLLSGVAAQVAIKVSGNDLTVLRRLQHDVEAAIEDIPGVADLFAAPQELVTQVDVRPDRAALARLGLTVGEVTETVELALEGEEISRLQLEDVAYPIVVRLREQDRRDLRSLRKLRVHGAASDAALALNLEDLATVERTLTANGIDRENLRRRVVVQHNVEGRSLGEVVADVRAALEPLRAGLPEGYQIRVSGQFEAQAEATRIIVLLSFVSLALMGLLIWSHFRSVNLVLQTLLNVPMAFVGAFGLLLLTGQTLSVATLVGLVSLGGIAARNKILLLDHYLHLLREEDFSPHMIERAGQERIVPVLMTALTSGIALLPLLLFPGEPGRELLYPVATVIVGGLVSTTLLDLLLTPGVFWLYGRRAALHANAQRRGTDARSEDIATTLEPELTMENPT